VSKSEQAARKEVEWVSIDRLDLDPLNPRLPDGMEHSKQPQLLETLAKEYDLTELGQSISDNGYFSEEPLVSVPGRSKGRWTVVEGNRRLAALKLLANPDAAPRMYRNHWRELSTGRKLFVDFVPILVYDRRTEVTPYLGYRHITGVLQWRPYQKARYIAQLVEDGKQSFAEIARTIGSKAPTVREHYVAYTLVRQARDAFAIDTTNVEDSFGVLRRALSNPNVRDFMGVRLDLDETALKRPLPNKKAKQVEELFSWMFGLDGEDAVLRDSRGITKLGVVLEKAEAIESLRTTRDLDLAFELAGGEERRLIHSLGRASYYLDEALPMAIRHRRSEEVARAFAKCRSTFRAIDRHFQDDADKQ
jgi:ParB-like chromosome segregation protein Spo0J